MTGAVRLRWCIVWCDGGTAKIDLVTGELLSVAYDLTTDVLRYVRVNSSGQIGRVLPFVFLLDARVSFAQSV